MERSVSLILGILVNLDQFRHLKKQGYSEVNYC
jgi:hypothetical protein